MQVTASLTDVRNTSDLTDYAGELQVIADLNISDRDPSSLWARSFPASQRLPVRHDGSAALGPTCSATTTADSILPGMVPEGKRVIWELGRVAVMDGGPDNLAVTADNNVFAIQGVFVP